MSVNFLSSEIAALADSFGSNSPENPYLSTGNLARKGGDDQRSLSVLGGVGFVFVVVVVKKETFSIKNHM